MTVFPRHVALRKRWLLLCVSVSAVIAALLALPACSRKRSGPVVIYLIDTLRPDHLSVYGAARETSPAASAFAQDAITFTNAHSISSWTRASIATLFTSALPSQVGAIGRYGRLEETRTPLALLFRQSGWKTAAFISNGNIFDPRLGFQRGFDLFVPVSHTEKPTAREVVDPAVRYIESQKSPRFFLYVHVIDPHRAYRLEPTYQALFPEVSGLASSREELLTDYDRTVRQADDQFQSLANALRRRGWWQDALVVYTADHGEEFFEHEGLGHGTSLFEEQIRIPLLLKLPHNKDGGTRRSDLVTLADLTPTIADAVGLPPSKDWIGSSLLRKQPEDREIYFTEELDANRLSGLRKGRRMLIVRLYPKLQKELYDLAQDPGEHAGLELPCGSPATGPQELLSSLDRGNAADTADYPGVTLEKVSAVPLSVDLRINLAKTPQPFVSAEDACRFSSQIGGAVLELHQRLSPSDPFHLQLATNAHGEAPILQLTVSPPDRFAPIDLQRPDSPFRISRREAHYISGTTTDELLNHLRALGYLAGGNDEE